MSRDVSNRDLLILIVARHTPTISEMMTTPVNASTMIKPSSLVACPPIGLNLYPHTLKTPYLSQEKDIRSLHSQQPIVVYLSNMQNALISKKVNRRRALAVGVSLGLHVLLVLGLALSTNSHFADLDLKGDGTSDVQGINVRLVDLHDSSKAGAPATEPPAPEVQRVNDFLKMTTPDLTQPKPSVTTPNPAKSLADALGENPFQQKASAAATPKTVEASHVNVNDTDNKTSNDLWKAIAPCWNRIADKRTLSVTLEVSFSPLGNLAKPPVIKRDPSAGISNQVLRSESQAISALSQCGPYLMAFGQEHVQVRFPKNG